MKYKSYRTRRPAHGHSSGGKMSPTYISWKCMIERCHDENAPNYRYYGALGIEVCEKWRENFINFLKDMGERPDDTTLDRLDFEKGYFKENCRWASSVEQAANKRPKGSIYA